jgi:hypothetical protein
MTPHAIVRHPPTWSILAIARYLDSEVAVIRQDRLAIRAVAMIRGVLGFRAARRIPEVVRE